MTTSRSSTSPSLQMLRRTSHRNPGARGRAADRQSRRRRSPDLEDRPRPRARGAGLGVVEEVVLSTFSFAKYLMWKDLADRTETLKVSPFVRHMIDTPRDSYERGARFLDPREHRPHNRPGRAHGAAQCGSSSQIVAIHASGNDGDFVLEGPPGTGKSETIGNIIAHNLGLGRRVLFVSEKMAALDVVYRRLERLRSRRLLPRAALGKGEQARRARAARRGLGETAGAPGRRMAEEGPKLGAGRARLNGLVEALHAPARAASARAMRSGAPALRRRAPARARLGATSGRGRARPDPDALAALETSPSGWPAVRQLQPEDLDRLRRHRAVLNGRSRGSGRSVAEARRSRRRSTT